MITEVTYKGRLISVEKFSVGWFPRIIPRVSFKYLLEKAMNCSSPVAARKRAKQLIDRDDAQ